MPDSETTILRREMARLHGEFSEAAARIRELAAQVADLAARNRELEARLAYYENPHSPPSRGSIPSRRRQRAGSARGGSRAPAPSDAGRPGRRAGHRGVSAHRKADRTVRHGAPERCPGCGGGMRETRITTRMVTDIGPVQRCVTTAHVVHESVCGGCGAAHVPAVPAVRGTSMGPNMLAAAVQLYHHNMSVQDVADTLDGLFGAGLCKAAVQHALQAASETMGPHAGRIREGLADAKFLHIDETPFPVGGSTSSHAWVAVGGDRMHVTVAGTRGGAVLDVHYPFFSVPLTCDGYAPYRRFETVQRCWAHILRDAEDLAGRGRAEESLHRQLRLIYHRARLAPPDADCGPMVRETEAVAAQYRSLGHGFGGKLAGAAPDLFTFVSHPGMEPTNNAAERALRRTVIQRYIRHGLRTAGGMRMFGIIMTCLGTWRMGGLDVAEKLREVLAAA